MFGVPKSINIVNKINTFVKSDKKHNRKYKVVVTPPFTLLENYSKVFKNKGVSIGAQNCYYKDNFGSNTGAISPYMIKNLNAKYVIIGHSDNRGEGDTDNIWKDKVQYAIKNRLKIVFCIGEDKAEKKNGKTLHVLKKQLITNYLINSKREHQILEMLLDSMRP